MFKCERVLLQSFTVRRFWGKRKEKYEREEYAKDEDEEFSCLSLCVFVCVIKSFAYVFMCVYELCNLPRSYRQPGGNGQLLSRRYCTHSGWLFRCATRTASEFQGALAVSCKYFKQSKWPFMAANSHAPSLYSSNLRSTRYSSI